MNHCSVHGCHKPRAWCVWCPFHATAAEGPTWVCRGHATEMRPRASWNGWFTGNAAIRQHGAATIIHRDPHWKTGEYEARAMLCFRYGSHVGGVKLGAQIGSSDLAVYLYRGWLWAIAANHAIGLAADWRGLKLPPIDKFQSRLVKPVAR